MDENRSFHWEFGDSLRFFKCMSERNWSTHHTSNVVYLPVRVRSHAPCGLEKKYLTWFIPKRSLWQNQHPLKFKRHTQQTINNQSVKLRKNVSCSFSKTRNCKQQIIIRIVFLEVQDIKDELPNESWFFFLICKILYHCTRVGSREQTVNLLANSPSVVRVHAMVNLSDAGIERQVEASTKCGR